MQQRHSSFLPTLVACCRRKRGCFAKSSPQPVAAAADNVYNLEPVAVSASTDISNGPETTPPAAATGNTGPGNGRVANDRNYENLSPPGVDAAVHYDTMWHASTPSTDSPPQPNPVSPAQAPDPDSQFTPQRHDSGTTLVDNTLYEPSKVTPSGGPLYENVAFHAGSSPTHS